MFDFDDDELMMLYFLCEMDSKDDLEDEMEEEED